MKKIKVASVIGTRPEIIRLSRILEKFDQYFDHTIVHTGQNYDYELNQVFFDDLGIRKPDYFLNAASETAAQTIGNVIIEVDKIFEKIQPEAMLVLGDTNSCLSAIAAKRKKIPIFHMEAGNRCFDQRVPEETNRKIVDHIADINMPYSSISREYLLNEGISPDRVIKTGSPMYEVLQHNIEKIEGSAILERLNLSAKNYFLVSAHREENIDSPMLLSSLTSSLNFIAENFAIPIIVSTHPRTRNKIKTEKLTFHEHIELLKPLGFHDYNKLQMNAKAVLSDSGTINEESSILNFPALNIRESHERPEAMEEGAVMMVGLDKERIMQALELLEKQSINDSRIFREVEDYKMPNVSEKVARIIISYIDYVNRVVWKNYP